MVTSGMDLKAHYCPQETFAILSRNKGAVPGNANGSIYRARRNVRISRARIGKSLKSLNFKIIEIYRV